jgi:heat shock protein HtpX
MLVIAVVIAGVISFFGEMVFRLFFQNALFGGFRRRGGDSDRKGGAGLAIIVAVR